MLLATLLAVAACSGGGGTSDSGGGASSGRKTAGAPTCTVTAEAGPEPTTHSIEAGGTKRTYLLAAPRRYDGRPPAPLVVDLHGFTSNAADQDAMSRLSEKGTARGFVVVTPQALDVNLGSGPQPLWNVFAAYSEATKEAVSTTAPVAPPPGDDVAFLNGLVDRLESDLCVDPDREYVTGMSNGAGMAAWLVCQPSNRFAAAAFVSGINQTKACPAATVPPFVAFHGDSDAVDPYTGGDLAGFPIGMPAVEERVADFAAKQGCGTPPTEQKAPRGVVHEVWPCPAGQAAELYRVIGGSHSWPGSPDPRLGPTRSIDASDLILRFFDRHRR